MPRSFPQEAGPIDDIGEGRVTIFGGLHVADLSSKSVSVYHCSISQKVVGSYRCVYMYICHVYIQQLGARPLCIGRDPGIGSFGERGSGTEVINCIFCRYLSPSQVTQPYCENFHLTLGPCTLDSTKKNVEK